MSTSDEQMRRIVAQLQAQPGLAEGMPDQEGAMVRMALAGRSVYEIASEQQVSEDAVWRVLGSAARLASGTGVTPVETGGLGSDTDPGVTGGYGDTGFGSLGNEPPEVMPEEPPDELA